MSESKITQDCRWVKSQESEFRVFSQRVQLNDYKCSLKNYTRLHHDILPKVKSHMSIIDVCCGPFSIANFLAEDGKAKCVVGVDSLIDRYLSIFRHTTNVTYIVSRAEGLPFKDNSYDLSLCINALDHTQNWHAVISELVRVIKPGGRVYLDFEQTSYFERFLISCGWKKYLAEHHIANLSVAGVIAQLKKGGACSIEKIKYEPWLSLKKIKVFIQSMLFRKQLNQRQAWETAISSLNLSLRKRIVYYCIQLYNFAGFIIYHRPHANFIRIAAQKCR